jgi:cytochrome P450
MKPITLSDGTHLPAGTYISVPANALSHDAGLFPEPEKFDGLRFYKMRLRSPADANRHQLTTLDNTAMYFGGGRHGCPGRGFVSVEAKMIISALVLKYDFKLKDGDITPRDFLYHGLLNVNPAKELLIRDRVDI